jgi:hypothetical protein
LASTLNDETGHYRLRSSWGGDDGAVVEPHRVCIVEIRHEGRGSLDRLPKEAKLPKQAQEKLARLKKEELEPRRVPRSYEYPIETPLRVEVHFGPQVIELEVK